MVRKHSFTHKFALDRTDLDGHFFSLNVNKMPEWRKHIKIDACVSKKKDPPDRGPCYVFTCFQSFVMFPPGKASRVSVIWILLRSIWLLCLLACCDEVWPLHNEVFTLMTERRWLKWPVKRRVGGKLLPSAFRRRTASYRVCLIEASDSCSTTLNNTQQTNHKVNAGWHRGYKVTMKSSRRTSQDALLLLMKRRHPPLGVRIRSRQRQRRLNKTFIQHPAERDLNPPQEVTQRQSGGFNSLFSSTAAGSKGLVISLSFLSSLKLILLFKIQTHVTGHQHLAFRPSPYCFLAAAILYFGCRYLGF